MRKLAWETSFERAYRKWVRKNPGLQKRIFEVLDLLAADLYSHSNPIQNRVKT